MKHAKLPLMILVIIFLNGCSADKSPSQTYNEYNLKVIEGISYEEDKAHYSKRKQKEVESKFPQYMAQMNKSRDEVVELYLSASREIAQCKEITLINEIIDGESALLLYTQKDLCGNESLSPEKQIITMVKEGDWKIENVEISL